MGYPKVGLYNVDSRASLPNYALMKISRYHKERGASVEPYLEIHKNHYDKIYASAVFSKSDKSGLDPERMEIGGSAWSIEKRLPQEIDDLEPDYSFFDFPHSIGFTERGCRFNCKDFCIVPKKEGKPKSYRTVEQIWTNRNSDFVILMDDDFFGGPNWREMIDQIRRHDLRVNFSQGLNIRIITEEQCKALASVNFSNLHGTGKQVHFAWDRFKDERLIDAGIQRVMAAGIKPYQMVFYILVGCNTTPEQDMYRIMKIRALGCDPYVMPFNEKDPYQKRLKRWVNARQIFYSVEWKDYSASIKKSRTLPVIEAQESLFQEGTLAS